jgi:8-oxo-dGTP pyrophosphatase MutT (NUDIX family)
MRKYPQQIASRTIFSNEWINVFAKEYEEETRRVHYTVVQRPDAVVVIPQKKTGELLLQTIWRYPIEKESIEFPMGAMEVNETPEQAAQRELNEEVHITASHLTQLGTFFPAPGLLENKVIVFHTLIEDSQAEGAIPQEEEAILQLHWFTQKEVREKIMGGDITEGFTLSAFLFFQLHSPPIS